MKALRRFSFCFLLALSCCSKTEKSLDIAEEYLNEKPDTALLLLKQIPPSALKTRKESSRHALLMSAALDKNRMDIASDTLIAKAVDYYSSHKPLRYRMMAYYYHGVVLKNGKLYPAAIVSLEKAETVASTLNDYYHLGLINRNKANVFTATNNTQEAITCMQKAVSYFADAGADNYKAYAELSLAIDYLNNKDYGKSDSLLKYIRREYNDSNLLHYCDLYQASILTETNAATKEALELFQKVPLLYFGILTCANYAMAHELIQNRDSADYWLSKGYSLCRSHADSAAMDYSQSRIAMLRGDFERAYYLENRATAVQDSLTRSLLKQSVSGAQRDFYRNQTLLQEDRARTMKRTAFLLLIIGLLFSLLVVAWFINRLRRKDQLLKNLMTRIALNDQEMDRVNKEKASLVGSLFSSRIKHLDTLTKEYLRMEDGTAKDLAFKSIKQSVSALRDDPDVFLSLEKDLDRYCNGIMTKLRRQVPRITGDNLRIISLFFAGFSYDVIQLVMNSVSTDSLRMAKTRFRKEIVNSDAPDKEFFLDMLITKRPLS